MNFHFLILALLILPSCKMPDTNTYEQGIEHCNAASEVLQKENPGALISTLPDCLVGYKIPSFEARTIAGKQITSDYFEGKLTIVNFWFIGCQPCVAEIPGLNQLVEKIGSNRVNYLSITRENKEDIESFLVKHPWRFDHIGNADSLITNVFKLRWGFPTTLLVNQKSEIIMAFSGGRSDSTAVRDIRDRLEPMIEQATDRGKW